MCSSTGQRQALHKSTQAITSIIRNAVTLLYLTKATTGKLSQGIVQVRAAADACERPPPSNPAAPSTQRARLPKPVLALLKPLALAAHRVGYPNT